MKSMTFSQFKLLKESENNTSQITSKVILGDGNSYPAFEISDDVSSENYGKNKDFAPIVRAFKKGANWGWTRDNSGADKAVKISGKKLYLAGGSVRDHLLGKKTRNVELATNASPDEVMRILKQNGFEFISHKKNQFNSNPSNQYFWVSKVNKSGKPFSFGIKVNNNEFELDLFMKTPRGVEGDFELGTQSDDAAGRDFTINGMYIALTNDNGPNKELYDFYGGMHHLAAGKIQMIGDMESKFKEDPKRILRFARMVSNYGNPSKISHEERGIVASLSKLLNGLDKNTLVGEFRKGMDKDDVDPRQHLQIHKDLGLLDHIFPNKILNSVLPKELSEFGDKFMSLAWLLKLNDRSSLNDIGLQNSDVSRIKFLLDALNLHNNIDPHSLERLTNGYMTNSVPDRLLRSFVIKLGGVDPSLIDAFLTYVKKPRIKVYINSDGQQEINPQLQDLVDPFEHTLDVQEAQQRILQLQFELFNNIRKNS